MSTLHTSNLLTISESLKKREMKNGQVEEEDEVSPSSSPPTPPSPLPISVGPGGSKYYFSSSPSASPPFSPATSADKLPLIPHIKESVQEEEIKTKTPSVFSLDRPDPTAQDSSSNCLRDLFEWFVTRCCSCYTLTLNPPQRLHQS